MAAKSKPRTPPHLDHDNLSETLAQQLHEGAVCDALVINSPLPPLVSPRGQAVRLYRCVWKNVTLSSPEANRLEAHDLIARASDLATLSLQGSLIERAEFISDRFTGADFTESRLKSVLFQECKLDLSIFRMARLQQCVFEHCNLIEADFYNADLSGTIFRDCDLSRADLSRTNLSTADIRDCRVDGIRGTPADMNGLIISPDQAPLLITLFGVTVR